ncbi:MAG: MaoC/PaaZ C-terminal domain-containing protein [Dehalococcoidia bacterium]|nr:MaoC/PaaZ C-terminal domain-containing protein [Dehalococcoidia bacterium]
MSDPPIQPIRRGRYFDEFTPGARFRSEGRTITEADIVMFATLIGGLASQFLDEEYAKTTPLGGRVAPGPLALSYAMAAIEPLLTGTLIGLLGVDTVRYHAPVRPGDTIRNEVEVISARPTSTPGRGVVSFKNEVKNQRDETVLTFETTVLLHGRPAASSPSPTPAQESG